MQQITERRFYSAQIRSAAPPRTVTGLAARFNHLSQDLGGWRERLAPGCFRASLAAGHDIKMLNGHDSVRVLASTRRGSLQLRESADGLAFQATMPDTSDGNDVLELCRLGELEMSFGFTCAKEDWEEIEEDDDGRSRGAKKKIPLRVVREATLFEISCVGAPAYSGATSIALAAAATRSIFPSGQVPLEIRSHVGLSEDAEWQALVIRGQALYAKSLLTDAIEDLRK